MKAENIELRFPDLGDPAKARFISFSDASLGNLSDGGSQGGFIIFPQGENGNFAPLILKSEKIKHTVESTNAAETLALHECVENCFLTKSVLQVLKCSVIKKTKR